MAISLRLRRVISRSPDKRRAARTCRSSRRACRRAPRRRSVAPPAVALSGDQRSVTLVLPPGCVFERDGGEQFERPGRAQRMPREAAGLVRERMHPDQTLRRGDFAIDEFGPHDMAARIAHGAEIGAADAQIHFRGDDGRALGPEPFLHALRLGEAFPHQIARRVEHARDDEVGAFGFGKHVLTPQLRRDAALIVRPAPSSRRRICRPACRSATRRMSSPSACSLCRLRPAR